MEDLKPKIRAVEVFPTIVDGKEMVILKDPLDLCGQMVFLSPESFFLVSLMDGNNSCDDLRMEFFKKKGILPSREEISLLVNQLSSLGLLEDENYFQLIKIKAENIFRENKRKPICAGSSYPESKERLIEFLKEVEKIDVPLREKEPDILIAPHLDINISKAAYAHCYKNLDIKNKNIVIIFGVSHFGLSKPLSILPIPFETPLGIVPIEEEISKRFIENFGEPDFYDVLSHSKEHSIELQTIFLQYFLKKDFSIVPILVDGHQGHFMDYYEFFNYLRLRDDIFYVAAIDLSHIGPRYGHNFPATEEVMEKAKEEENLLLDFVIKKDIKNFEVFKEEKADYLKICGIDVLKVLLNFPIKNGTIRFHHTGFMPQMASAVNCVSMDVFF